MRTPQGVHTAKQLVGISDVVAENFSRGVMDRWGMDYASLRQIKPDIIMLSMSGMGRTGPWRDYVSYGQTLQAWSGFTYLTGFPEAEPSGPASAYSDAASAMAGAQAVLLALIHRARTGEGQWIDLSQFEVVCSLLETLVLDAGVNQRGKAIRRTGNKLPYGAASPHGAYRCQGDDRWIAISVFCDQEWVAFVQAIGNPPWAMEEKFATASARRHHSDELDQLVQTWTAKQSAEDAMHLLQSVGVAAGVIQSGADLADGDPHMRQRGFFREVPDSRGELHVVEGPPHKLSRTPGGPLRGAPEFGAHQTYVARDLLGMSDDEAAQHVIDGVFD